MQVKVKRLVELTITHVQITLPVCYGEEDIPNDFPGRDGDIWEAIVEIDTGQIVGTWNSKEKRHLYMKVCDGGTYELLRYSMNRTPAWDTVAKIRQDYVPHGVVPGEYGDYVDLHINEQGRITNWPKKPDVSQFFLSDE